jgi:hypothetical protein
MAERKEEEEERGKVNSHQCFLIISNQKGKGINKH